MILIALLLIVRVKQSRDMNRFGIQLIFTANYYCVNQSAVTMVTFLFTGGDLPPPTTCGNLSPHGKMVPASCANYFQPTVGQLRKVSLSLPLYGGNSAQTALRNPCL